VTTKPFKFVIERLETHHDRNTFTCGNHELDRYFHQQIGQDFKKHVTAPFVLIDKDIERVAGFYTLSMNSVILKELPDNIQKKLPKYPNIPAVLLGRLAVDEKYKGQRLGEYLLMDALQRSLDSEIVTYCMIVDAKDEDAKAFYLKYRFIQFSDYENRLFLPMKMAKELF